MIEMPKNWYKRFTIPIFEEIENTDRKLQSITLLSSTTKLFADLTKKTLANRIINREEQ